MSKEKKGIQAVVEKKDEKPKAKKEEEKGVRLFDCKWVDVEGDNIDSMVSTTRNVIEKPKFLSTPMAVDFCNFTGFTLMQNFSAVSLNLLENEPKSAIGTKCVCQCENCQTNINELNKKIADLNKELVTLKLRMNEPKKPNEEQEIERGLKKSNANMFNITNLLVLHEEVKKLITHGHTSASKASVSKALSSTKLKKSEPVIQPGVSMEDILKVKLKPRPSGSQKKLW